MARVFIIHGWDGYPEECWFLWLKGQLEERGHQVTVPQMPEAATPEIGKWVPFLAELVGQPDADTYFVGHSIGVQTIMRYLAGIDAKVGGLLAVAGFFDLIPGSIGGQDDEAVAKPWLTAPIDCDKVKRQVGGITAIFSDNDPFVSLDNAGLFSERLGAKTVIVSGQGHMGGGDDLKEAPVVLEELLRLLES